MDEPTRHTFYNIAFDLCPPNTSEQYQCGACYALVELGRAVDHARFHRTTDDTITDLSRRMRGVEEFFSEVDKNVVQLQPGVNDKL